MSPAFGRYLSGVNVVAPKPTTFNVKLVNGEGFVIKYNTFQLVIILMNNYCYYYY